MTLKSLFQKRHKFYTKDLLKYIKHIVNDHFILIFFLLIGVGGYVYTQFLDTMTLGMVEPRVLVGIIFFVFTSSGSITLLLEPADQIFLLPKEQAFKQILKQLTLRSFLEQLITTGVLTFVTFPIFVATLNTATFDSFFIFVALASLKGLNLLVKMTPFFEEDQTQLRKIKTSLFILKILAIISLLFVNILLTAIIVGILLVISMYLFLNEKNLFKNALKWEKMIEAEENRQQRIYRFIQLFINVPQQETKIHRLPWLDKSLDWLSKRYQEAPYYYVLRTVVRNPEYSNLVLRITLIGMVLLAATAAYSISILLTVLFLYIIGFQMVSLVDDIRRTPQFQLYPLTEKNIFESVFRMIFEILSISAGILTFGSLNSQGLVGLTMFPVGLSFAYLFSYFYVPQRLKMTKK